MLFAYGNIKLALSGNQHGLGCKRTLNKATVVNLKSGVWIIAHEVLVVVTEQGFFFFPGLILFIFSEEYQSYIKYENHQA